VQKRGLDFNHEKDDHVQLPLGGLVGDPHAMVLDIAPVAPPAVGVIADKDRKTRSNKDGTNSNNYVGSEDSSKGSVRSQ
jgi:hypothetical protein